MCNMGKCQMHFLIRKFGFSFEKADEIMEIIKYYAENINEHDGQVSSRFDRPLGDFF